MRPRTAHAARRLSELGHRIAEDDPHRPVNNDAVRDALESLNANISRLTSEVVKFRGNALNHVLFSGTGRIPGTGDAYWTTQTEVPFARVIVLAITNDLRIENNPPSSATGGAREGRGMLWCPAAMGRLEFPLVGNVITVYGTAGAFFDIVLLATAPA